MTLCESTNGGLLHLYNPETHKATCGYGHNYLVLEDRKGSEVECYRCKHILKGTRWQTWIPNSRSRKCFHQYKLNGLYLNREGEQPLYEAACKLCNNVIQIELEDECSKKN